jgi:hypothetical protein
MTNIKIETFQDYKKYLVDTCPERDTDTLEDLEDILVEQFADYLQEGYTVEYDPKTFVIQKIQK